MGTLLKLSPPSPGIVTEVSDYQAQMRYTDGDLIRFRNTFPEKLGGWEQRDASVGFTINGTARAILSGITNLGQDASVRVQGRKSTAKTYDSAAVEEGVVPGGGVAFMRALQKVGNLKGVNEDQQAGINIALRAFEYPLKTIASNAGEESSVVAENVKKSKGSEGFNAATGEYGDMLKMGILDPAKVTRTALQAAGSIGGMMITTECMVSELPAKDTAPAGGMPPGGMPDMGGMM